MTEKELAELTKQTAERLFGKREPGESPYELWRDFDPELAKHISMFYTGRLYAREVLTQRERELCAIAAMTVRSFWDELEIHMKAALNVGATAKEIAEVVFQMTTYGGAPCMVEGLKVLKRVLEARGEWKPAQ